MKYLIHIFLVTSETINMEVEYEKEYDLRKDVTIMGNNGVTKKMDEHYTFYPAHQIMKIEVEEVKP